MSGQNSFSRDATAKRGTRPDTQVPFYAIISAGREKMRGEMQDFCTGRRDFNAVEYRVFDQSLSA
jgi:hypothetical protein